ncbi:hypothetical protein PR002_g3741 [Phytophthora rubi]|uniref:RxLR effector protein n=1 Tax=Phytophthora rubi TaxID=129364 RepID=A0A6A3NBB0_9STRA|nr:hypothetical protein PR002_g3741 [Phytophthora rubi]
MYYLTACLLLHCLYGQTCLSLQCSSRADDTSTKSGDLSPGLTLLAKSIRTPLLLPITRLLARVEDCALDIFCGIL